MNCSNFQERLEALLDDTLSAVERRALERHAATCPRCRELEGLGRLGGIPPGGPGPSAAAAPEDLAASILARTTGSACGRARERLCDHADGGLDALEASLVSRHTAHCDGCGRAERALRRLAEDLPAMAELMPDAAFVGDVLAATAPRYASWGRRLAAWAEAWNRLLARPRFGLEAGYVGGLAVWVLFGLSASPFGHIPEQALEVLQRGPTAGIERAERAVTTLQSQLGEIGRQTWEASGERSAQALDAWSSDVGRRLDRTSAARGTLLRHGEELGEAALQLDLEQTTRAARGIGAGLGALWRDLVPAPENESDTEPNPPTPAH